MKDYQSPCLDCGAPTSHRSQKCKAHRIRKCERPNCSRHVEPPNRMCERHRKKKEK